MPRSGTLLTTVPELSVSESQPLRRPICVGVNCSVIRQVDGGACTPTQSCCTSVKSRFGEPSVTTPTAAMLVRTVALKFSVIRPDETPRGEEPKSTGPPCSRLCAGAAAGASSAKSNKRKPYSHQRGHRAAARSGRSAFAFFRLIAVLWFGPPRAVMARAAGKGSRVG